MSVSPDDIQKMAHLSRLKVEDDKIEKLSADINNILGLVDQLQQANTDGVAPMAHPLDEQCLQFFQYHILHHRG